MAERSIVITGASGGLGGSLAEIYSEPGTALLLMGRNKARLAHITDRALYLGAQAQSARFSLAETSTLVQRVSDYDCEHPIDLLIVNAGVKIGNVDGIEDAAQMARVLDTNLQAAVHTVQAVIPGMIKRKRGQIALVSSLSAISPQPDLLSYSASKAGLSAYGSALRQSLYGSGISVTIICPGFIDTRMTEMHSGPTPFLVSKERAAKIIRKGLDRKTPYISFPIPLVLLAHLNNLLPVRLSDWFNSAFRAKIENIDDDI